jgi:diacylglycerol kinase family enzyme
VTPSLVILNARAGGGRAARFAAEAGAIVKQAGATLVLTQTLPEAQACIQAQPPGSRIVLVGGDGTVQGLLSGLLAGRHTLGLVPMGSGNDLARFLGLARLGPHGALHRALRADARPIDLGHVQADGQEWHFASSLAAGFDAAIAARALKSPAWLRGLPRYLWATLGALARLEGHQFTVVADGQQLHHGPGLLASSLNTPSYGSGMPVAPGAQLTDGHLDLLIAGHFGRLGALAMLPRLLTGTHLGHPRVRVAPFKTMMLTSATPLPLAADGEPLAPARQLQVQVLPGAIKMVFGAG